MQKHLYILCEGERDEVFYERITERFTGQRYDLAEEFRLRRGSNFDTVISSARVLLTRIKHWQGRQEVGVIIAVDNDRAPDHPAGRQYSKPLPSADLKKTSRYQGLKKMIEAVLGSDSTTWPVQMALAVPVEMIESWVLALLDPNGEELPPFSEADSFSARAYYGKRPAPPQLKDRVKELACRRGQSLDDLFWDAAEASLADAAGIDGSLRLFLDDLKNWQPIA